MTKSDAARQLEDLAREVDLLVYRLELAGRSRGEGTGASPAEEGRLRRELEDVRERLTELARALDL